MEPTADGGQVGRDRARPVPWWRRVALGLVVAGVVFGLSLQMTWPTYAHTDMTMEQHVTVWALRELREAVLTYQAKTGAPPGSLEQLASEEGASFQADDAGHPLDGWLRPFVYERKAKSYRITSYGRDGRPGGRGLDYDLSTENLHFVGPPGSAVLPKLPEASRPTFGQFLHAPGAARILAACAVPALLALGVVMRVMSRWPRPWAALLQLAGITFAAWFVAASMAMFEAAIGHH